MMDFIQQYSPVTQALMATLFTPTTQFINFILDFLSMFRHTTQQLIK
jgi:hypothetical protein